MYTPDQLSGARSLISDGLKLEENDTLLLLNQVDLGDAADCIKTVAAQLGVQVDQREFRREDFMHSYPEAFSPEKLSKFNPPQGIVLLIEWSEATTEWRLELLRELKNQPQQWKIASMPGVDLVGLATSACDFKAIRDYSLIVFAILSRSYQAILETINPYGDVDKLIIPIGTFLPILSTGEISAGSWGNFPSGETYIVPNTYKATGRVTVRGSIPMRPLESHEWVRYEVRQGRVLHSSIDASSVELKEQYASLFFTRTGRAKCTNANALAELGIGTNPGISNLTGKPIFDEKKLGTVHVAFGGNTQFNGPLRSQVHHDIVCTGASLTLLNRYRSYRLISEGNFALTIEDAVPQLDHFPPYARTRRSIRLGAIQPHFESDDVGNNVLSLRYVPMGKNPVLIIARGSIATLTRELLQVMTAHDRIKVGQLFAHTTCAAEKKQCQSIVTGLLEYGLLREL